MGLQASAQDTLARAHQHLEIGIKTNVFFERWLNGTKTDSLSSPYLLYGKYHLRQWTLRLGVGGFRKWDKESEEGFADSKTTTNHRLDLRLGIERSFPLGKRLKGSLGLDITGFGQENKAVDDTGFDVVKDITTIRGVGAGPVAGLRLDISKRLSLYTETFFYYTFSEKRVGRFFKNFPVFDDEVNVTSSQEVRFGMPTAIYLSYRF